MDSGEDVILAHAVGKFGLRGSIWVTDEETRDHGIGAFNPFDDANDTEDANVEGHEDTGSTRENGAAKSVSHQKSSLGETSRAAAAESSNLVTVPQWAPENGRPRLWCCAKIPINHDAETVEETVGSDSK